jgi:hypothetical protein
MHHVKEDNGILFQIFPYMHNIFFTNGIDIFRWNRVSDKSKDAL